MSRYTILIILNTPLIIAGILSAVVSYKLNYSNRRRFIYRVVLWMAILAGLIFAENLYKFLFSNQLTVSEPLSLFDVIQITGIILTFYIANRAYTKTDLLERKFQDLHQAMSIQLSENNQVTASAKTKGKAHRS